MRGIGDFFGINPNSNYSSPSLTIGGTRGGSGTISGSGGTSLSGSGGGCPSCATIRCGSGYTCVTDSSGCGSCQSTTPSGGGGVSCPSCATVRCGSGYTCVELMGCGTCRPTTVGGIGGGNGGNGGTGGGGTGGGGTYCPPAQPCPDGYSPVIDVFGCQIGCEPMGGGGGYPSDGGGYPSDGGGADMRMGEEEGGGAVSEEEIVAETPKKKFNIWWVIFGVAVISYLIYSQNKKAK